MNTLVVLAALAAGQTNPYAPPPPGDEQKRKAEARREARDQVLRSVGNDAMGFCKHYGDLGIYALQACQPATAKALVALHDGGDLAKLRDPRLALEAVKRHGEPAAAWLVSNHARLADPDALECFAADPMEFVFDLRDIGQAAEARRASKKSALPWPDGVKQPDVLRDPRNLALAGASAIILYLLWRQRKLGN